MAGSGGARGKGHREMAEIKAVTDVNVEQEVLKNE